MHEIEVAIIDYGAGNLKSVQNMLEHLGVKSIITSNASEIRESSKIILPGVGKFDKAVEMLHAKKLFNLLIEEATRGKWILGICLGAQLLLERSEEGKCKGLGLIPGESQKFKAHEAIRVPHMGWNSVLASNRYDWLFKGIPEPRFYFAHSYFMTVEERYSLSSTTYNQRFDSSICHKNVIGVQFHPEKSLKNGMQLLQNFINHV